MSRHDQDPVKKWNNILPRNKTGVEAVFLGWQHGPHGELLPLYNIMVADHSSFLSTVSDTTLQDMNLRVPKTPSPYPGTLTLPWQNAGIDVEQLLTARNILQAAHLDYPVIKKPRVGILEPRFGNGDWIIVRKDNGVVLSAVDSKYEPVQNRDAFTFFDTLVKEKKATYLAAGQIGDGQHAWILASLPGFIAVHRNDLVIKGLLPTNSFVTNGGVRAKVTPIRVVCNNTLSVSQNAGKSTIHSTRDSDANKEQADALLRDTSRLFKKIDNSFNRMAEKKITQNELQNYVMTLTSEKYGGDNITKLEEMRDKVIELYESGNGANLSRGTLWGAFNSVSEYTDHIMLNGGPNQKLNSIWFGKGEQLKLKAYQLAESMI